VLQKDLVVIREDVIKRTWETLEGPIQQHGYALIEVEFGGAGGRQVLRLFIDRENGIGLDDCQTVSRLVDPILDAEDFIDGNYVLEVSSPGFDRPLRRPQDFERFIGEPVVVKTHMPVNGRKRIKGLLTAFDSGMVAIACEDAVYNVHLENVRKANLDR
jgi:ribosome maturation factor RimP